MKIHARTQAMVIATFLLGGCAGNKEFINVGSQSFNTTVPASAAIRLHIGAGEVEINGVDGSELVAQVELACQERDKGCLKRAGAVRFDSRADTSAILVALEPTGMLPWRDLQATVAIQLPKDRALFVQMGAGELEITGMQNCVELDMYAGEAELHIAKSAVGSVGLDVGTGDTGLVIDGESTAGKRAWLVGAELEWNEGAGWCRVYGDLQFGDLTVYLDDE